LSKPGEFSATFHPAKRVKKYFRRYWSEQIPDTKLPVVLGTLDEKLTLEEFCFVDKAENGGRIHIMGWMCPWCGITMQTREWSHLGFRCPADGIVSKPYARGGA
jgi:hypothetical protein